VSLKDSVHNIAPSENIFVTESNKPISKIIGNKNIIDSLEEGALQQIADVSQIPRWKALINTPDTHVGKGCTIGQVAVAGKDGMISPSIVGVDIGCGMSVMRTGVRASDLSKSDIRNIMNDIQKEVPVGFAQKREKPISIQLLRSGLLGLWRDVAYLMGDEIGVDETDVIEPTYGFTQKTLTQIEDSIPEAFYAGEKTLGTLGGGNHFIELQVAKVQNGMEDVANKWGIFDGELLIMIHSGSRGFGFKVAQYYEKLIKTEMEMWGVVPPNPDLAYAPIQSPVGQEYFQAQLVGANAAKLNRYLMRHGIRKAIKSAVGVNIEATTLYDLSHNVAYKMYHGKHGELITHRKGSTLALPAGHFLNPKLYKETGHPVLIPGSMGTASYILVGNEEAEKTFYSVNHGAGRRMSRRNASKNITVDRFKETLQVQNGIGEVMINTRNLKDYIDEAPDAYKNIDDVIDSVVQAKLATPVIKCIPIAVLKGTDREFAD
jgi:tRNA-splicing ligase RtcB